MKNELKVSDVEVSPPDPKRKWVYQRLVVEVPKNWEIVTYYDHMLGQHHFAVEMDNANGHRVVIGMRRKLTAAELPKKARST